MVRVVIDGEIVEKTEEEILEMALSFDGRRTKHKQLLSETAKLILAALLERPLTRFGIAKRLGARTDDLSDYLYYKTRSPSCLSRAILLKLGLVQRHGKKWTSTFCVNPDKLDDALSIEGIGKYTNEGMGEIIWKEAKYIQKPLHTPNKIKFRKMLPTNLSETQHKLLIAMLLHDCVHTERHNSKIYHEVAIQDEYVAQLVKNHHNYDIDDRELPLLSTLQYYDRLSSSISRKFRFSTTSRYRVSELEKIDFHSLARDLEQRQYSLYALYSYIYKSQELKKINEALSYGFSSLRNHLLLMVNLYLNDNRRVKVSLTEW